MNTSLLQKKSETEVQEQILKRLIVLERYLEDKEKLLNLIEKKINDELHADSIKRNILNNKSYDMTVKEKEIYDTIDKLNFEENIIDESEKIMEDRKKINKSIQEMDQMEKILNEQEQNVNNSVANLLIKKKILSDIKKKINYVEKNQHFNNIVWHLRWVTISQHSFTCILKATEATDSEKYNFQRKGFNQ